MKHRLGVKGKLLISFFSFSFVVILVLLVLEVVLFSDVFRTVKLQSLRSAASKLEGCSEETLSDLVADEAAKNGICINVFDEDLSFLAGDHAGGQCVVHMMRSSTIELFYETTAKQSGGYFESFLTAEEVSEIIRKNEMSGEFFHDFKKNEKDSIPEVFLDDTSDSALVCELVKSAEGETYFAILSAAMTPVDSTMDAIHYVLLIIAGILILISIIMAFILSKVFSGPIVKLNNASKNLPYGKFDGTGVKGYREVEELSATLSAAAEEISKTDRLRKELIANVSHDLRTPLTLISGYSEAMRDLPGENKPENLQTIIDEAHRLSALVTDLMDLSKLDTNTSEVHFKPIEMGAFLRGWLSSFEKMSAVQGYNIQVDIRFDQASVHADPIRLQQVIGNLVNNAMNYCGEDRFVGIRASLIMDEVLVEVIDHGVGMEPDKLEHIWERYYRVNSSISRSSESTGLGLSIVKRILDLHGARYGVESYVEIGSRFWFSLKKQ